MAYAADSRAFVHASEEGRRSETTSPYLRASPVQKLPAKMVSMHPITLELENSCNDATLLSSEYRLGADARSSMAASHFRRCCHEALISEGTLIIRGNVSYRCLSHRHTQTHTHTHTPIFFPELRLWSKKKP